MRRAAGIVLMLAGALLALATVEPLVRADHRTALAQERMMAEVPSGRLVATGARLHATSAPVAVAVEEGRALAVLRIPRFGATWRWVALEGTSPDVLSNGPGHYEGTALPGAAGNAAFAAHRAGHGSPFLDFDDLRAGDEVVVEQGSVRWTYALTGEPRIVPTSATWVLRQTRSPEITLTTCWPKWGSASRMFVRGELVDVDRAP